MKSTGSPPDIRRISAAETRPLRQSVLRPHQRPEDLVYAGDDDPESIHLGGFIDGALAGIASFNRQPMTGDPREGDWQLRGMATEPARRNSGLGGALLVEGIRLVALAGGRRVWCNGRVPAAGFYEKHGFVRHGEEYELPGTGPHYLMSRELPVL